MGDSRLASGHIDVSGSMLGHMRTTVRIRDELLQKAKRRAHSEGRTLTAMIEEGLGLVLARRRAAPAERVELPVSRCTGGVLPGVDLSRSSELEDVMSGA